MHHLIDQRVFQIQNMPDNWDQQGAVAASIGTIENTLQFLNLLPKLGLENLLPEDIRPTPYGTIEIDWHDNSDLLSVEIGFEKIGFFSVVGNAYGPSSDGIPLYEVSKSLAFRLAFDHFFVK